MDERKRIRLTKYSTEAGWAPSFAPGDLEQASKGLASEALGDLAGGMETRDDAKYGPVGGGLLLQAVDIIAPVVDAPCRFGPFAAAVAGEVVEDSAARVTA